MSEEMTDKADFETVSDGVGADGDRADGNGGAGARLAFTGNFSIAGIGDISRRLSELDGPVASIDLAGISHIDTVGAWLVYRTARDNDAEILNADSDASRLIEAVGKADNSAAIQAPRGNAIERVLMETGESVSRSWEGLLASVSFLGSIVSALIMVIIHPRRMRWLSVVRQLEVVGVSALGIVGLMSFLIGVVVAQQGAVQLRQFGAEVFTINLVGRLTLRELGVLMTAIMVAGRSGSAFAAQIGTMKLTEEIDAMRTIGISPIEALVLPRVIASVFMMILLGFYSCVVAIIGGAILSNLFLDIPFITFLLRMQEVVPLHDLWVGLVKAPVFGLIVGMAGCYQGMQVSGNAEEVGLRTTAAVVQAIFMVIVLDAFFAVFFERIGWG